MIRSTDHNLNNPTKRIELSVNDVYDALGRAKQIVYLTQDRYDSMPMHDPNHAYVIIDANDKRYYYGDAIVIPKPNEIKYYIGINDQNEYELCVNLKQQNIDQIIPVARYKNAQKAINALQIAKKSNGPFDINLSLYETLIAYINRDSNINNTIINIISSFGHREDPKLQQLIESIHTVPETKDGRDVNPILREDMQHFRNIYVDTLWPIYASIYDVFIIFDFFKDKRKYVEPEHPDLSGAIDKIINIFS